MFPDRLQHQTRLPTLRCLHRITGAWDFLIILRDKVTGSHRTIGPTKREWAALGPLGSSAEGLGWVAHMVDSWCHVGLQTPEQRWQPWHKSLGESSALCSHSLRASHLAWGTTPWTAAGAPTPNARGDSLHVGVWVLRWWSWILIHKHQKSIDKLLESVAREDFWGREYHRVQKRARQVRGQQIGRGAGRGAPSSAPVR